MPGIRLALRQLRGTGDVGWNEKARRLDIQYHPEEVGVQAIREAIASAGYVTTLVETGTQAASVRNRGGLGR